MACCWLELDLQSQPIAVTVSEDAIEVTKDVSLVVADELPEDIDYESLTQLSNSNIPDDILDLINGDDSSLDNLFGGSYDEDNNVLTIFADSNSEEGITEIESMNIQLGDDSTIDEDDIDTLFIA